jgi:hypothetical protein
MSPRVGLLFAVLTIGCARPVSSARCAYPSAPSVEAATAYRYRVAAAPRSEELCVEVDLPKESALRRWAPNGRLRPFVRDVAVAGSGDFAPVPSDDGGWLVPACTADGGCRLRYRVLIAEAAGAFGDFDLAQAHRGVVLTPPSSWLLRPAALHAAYRLTVAPAPGAAFISGLARAPEADAAYAGDVAALDDTPYAAFGPLAVRALALDGGTLDVAMTPGTLSAPSRAAIDGWIDGAARAVASYFGAFAIPRAALIVKLEEGARVSDGHTMGNGGGAILIAVGERSLPDDLRDDWLLVHEMVHLSFPDVRRPWAEEGLATYVEPIIRARAGLLAPDEIWRGLIEGLPQGQPEEGDRGLDFTDTWGRRYWGGAAYWLLADLEIRERTGGRRSLDDVLRAVVRAGGNVAARWDLERVLALGDEVVGEPVLVPLRRRLGGAPERVDLDALWKRLGVSLSRGRVVYDESAPLAAVRRRISAP